MAGSEVRCGASSNRLRPAQELAEVPIQSRSVMYEPIDDKYLRTEEQEDPMRVQVLLDLILECLEVP